MSIPQHIHFQSLENKLNALRKERAKKDSEDFKKANDFYRDPDHQDDEAERRFYHV